MQPQKIVTTILLLTLAGQRQTTRRHVQAYGDIRELVARGYLVPLHSRIDPKPIGFDRCDLLRNFGSPASSPADKL